MKTLFIRLTLFILFATIFYTLCLLVVGNSSYFQLLNPNIKFPLGGYGHTFTRLAEAKQVKDIDVLILGSSHAYRGVDGSILFENGIKSFNLGSSAQSPIQTNMLIKRYLDSLNPKKVIYIVSPDLFRSKGIEASLDLISNDENDTHSIEMASRVNNLVVYNTLIYATVSNGLGFHSSFKEEKVKGKDIYVYGGYVERDIEMYKPKTSHELKLEYNEEQLEIFEENINLIKKINCEIYFVYAPIIKTRYQSYKNMHSFEFIMSKYPNYYDFNLNSKLVDSLHFYDSSHMNQRGVEIFNQEVIELIK